MRLDHEQYEDAMAEASARLDEVDNGTLTIEETRARAEVQRKKEEAAACAAALKSSTGGKGVESDESSDNDDDDGSGSSDDSDADSDNSDAVSKRKRPCRSEVSSTRSSTGHEAKRHKGSTPKKEEEATPSKRNAPPAVGHITISTARDMHRKLTGFANNFATGLYDQTTGRKLQHLQKDFRDARAGMPAVMKALSKGDATDHKSLAKELQTASDAVDKIVAFQKSFQNPNKTPISTMISSWVDLSDHVRPSAVMARSLAMRSLDHALEGGDLGENALALMDMSSSPSGKYGCKLITTDDTLREECSKALLGKLVSWIFERQINKSDIHASRIIDQVKGYVDTVYQTPGTLPGDSRAILRKMAVVVLLPDDASNNELKSALAAFEKEVPCLMKAGKTKAGASVSPDATVGDGCDSMFSVQVGCSILVFRCMPAARFHTANSGRQPAHQACDRQAEGCR